MLSDAINFVRKLSLLKLLNILFVRLSYTLSILLKKPLVWGKPWFISIEPASVCNLSCPQCPVGEGDIVRKRSFMDMDDYKTLLKEISGTTALLSLYFQGEPLMHKNITEFVRHATEAGIYTQISTNAQLMTEKLCRDMVEAGLDRIIISLDGNDQESYQTYRRGGDIQKVEDGIRTLNRLRREAGSKTPFIIVQFLVFRHNREQVSGVKKMAKELGTDRVWIKSAQIEYPRTAGEWIPEGSDHSRYEKDVKGDWKLRGTLRNRCSRLWQTSVITSDGIVVPCCFDKIPTFPMGSSGEQSLAEIWKSRVYQDFRKQVLSNRKDIAICTNCTEGIGRIYN
ncbi:radical SAM/SPASM domain-containing protein [Bacteroidota bacterium]